LSDVDEIFQWALQPVSHDQKDQLKVAIEKGDRTVTCEGVLGLTSLVEKADGSLKEGC
jgi:hypothetical protein